MQRVVDGLGDTRDKGHLGGRRLGQLAVGKSQQRVAIINNARAWIRRQRKEEKRVWGNYMSGSDHGMEKDKTKGEDMGIRMKEEKGHVPPGVEL